MKRSKRESNLNRTIEHLEKALHIANELTFNADGVNDVGHANAWGIEVLKNLKVIEVSEDCKAIVRSD